MTAGDLAAVVVTMLSIVAVVALLLALQVAWRTARALRSALADVEARTGPLVAELETTVERANAELDRVHQLVGSAESISATVDATSRLAYKALSAPVIKTVALASGTSKAARRLRKDR
jgi:light-regulated signal transduction histidine kinase (bacteriophytochrome)